MRIDLPVYDFFNAGIANFLSQQRIRALFLLIILFSTVTIFAQRSHTITGIVRDAGGTPLPGASIHLKNGSAGTVTDSNGRFSLSLPTGNSILEISTVGYLSQEVPVKNKSSFNVNLVSSTTALNEVVVVGYGTQRKRDVTGL